MKRLLWTLVAVLAAGVFLFALLLPPAPAAVETSGWGDLAGRTVAGAYHIHTTRSDGTGDKAAVAHAAARAGLRFIVLTDHGDATRPPDPPAYIEGVLCLDAVEISTDEGHYVALDMPRAPYPLGGAAEAVVEDVARLGGFGIAAHPDSPKPALRWTETNLEVDGIEWLNTDSEWRKDSRRRLARAGLAYLLRPGPALATLFDRPTTLARWDRMSATRPVVGLAGADAHGGITGRAEDTNRSLSGMIGIPSYEASFRTFTTRVLLDRPLSGAAADDGRAVYGAIRRGRVFSTIDALGAPALLDLRADTGSRHIVMGDTAPAGSAATIVARATLPTGGELVLMHGGEEVARSSGDLRLEVPAASGAYRVEVRLGGAPGLPPIPWLVSNPVYFLPPAATPSIASQPALVSPIARFPWRIEKDPSSSAILRTSDNTTELTYTIGPGARSRQFVALATDPHNQSFGAIQLSLAGDRPMRVSIQVRRTDDQRWGRSFYVDPAGSVVTARLDALRPIAGATGSPEASTLRSILLVLDLANSAPGYSGVLRVSSSALVK